MRVPVEIVDRKGGTDMPVEIQLIVAWASHRIAMFKADDPERGDGILPWVVLTAVLVAAALAVGLIIVNKAKQTANNVQTQ